MIATTGVAAGRKAIWTPLWDFATPRELAVWLCSTCRMRVEPPAHAPAADIGVGRLARRTTPARRWHPSCQAAEHMRHSLVLLSLLCLPTFACDVPESTDGFDEGHDRLEAFREAWSASDNPSLLAPDFNYVFAALPTQGAAAKTPWPGSYWPTYKDSINDRWAGPQTQSAAEKYALAFGKSGVEDAVSEYGGIDSLAGKACSSDAECDADAGSVCAKRRGATQGVCSETWFGICHAWAPAAILEAEPTKAVTYNGVEFAVNDLKALMSFAYNEGLEVKFLSLRCDERGDQPGVADSQACKDTNPGSFHVAIANLVGIQKRSLVEDRTYDYEVWNQPIRGYRITQNQALGAKAANELIGGGPLLSSQTKSGAVAEGAWNQLLSVTVAEGQRLDVRMTGSGDGDLYVRWNDQPNASSYACRPYAEGSSETCSLVVPAGVSSAKIAVHGYTASNFEVAVEVRGAASDVYAYNPKAVTLRKIQMELQWIAESPQTLDGNLAATVDAHTRKDVYDYVLELDAAGKIIGGEWIGASKRNHPDFLWLPVQKREATVAGVITYANVRKLFDLAAAPVSQTLLAASDSLAVNQWKHHGAIQIAGGAEALLTVTSGDADLYVRKDSQPTLAAYTCRPYLDGSAAEVCTITEPGTYYVSVHGYAASSYSLSVRGQ